MASVTDADIATALQRVVRRDGWQGMFKTAPLVAKEMHVRKVNAFRVNKVRGQLGIKPLGRGGRRRRETPAAPVAPPAAEARPARASAEIKGDEHLAVALREALESLQADVIQRFGLSKLALCWTEGQWQPVEVTRPRSDLITV